MVVPSSASAGSWKQGLLPDPVGTMTIVSRPSIAVWTACAWPGRNRRKPNRSRRLCLSSRPLNRVAWVMIPPFLSWRLAWIGSGRLANPESDEKRGSRRDSSGRFPYQDMSASATSQRLYES
jgi:hypothetical protein